MKRYIYHVLGEGLGKGDVVTLLDKVTDWESILVGVTGGESLVSHIEESIVSTLLNGVGDLLPLLLGWVDTSWVVCASVEEEDGSLLSTLDISNHALKVKPNCILVIVSVLGDLKPGVGEDGAVVGPRWVRDVDLLCARVPLCEELASDAESAGARDGLGDDEAVESRGALAVGEDGGGFGELWDSGDAGVLLVHLGLDHLVLGGANGWEDVWLSGIVTVCANTCSIPSEHVHGLHLASAY